MKFTHSLNPINLFVSAILHNQKPVVELLINHVKINASNRLKITPLLYAVTTGNLEIVELLINHGADVNKPRNDGSTALMLAIYHNHIDIVRLLICRGANIKATNQNGLFPLAIAAYAKNNNIAKILIGAGADLNQPSANQTVLHIAVLRNNLELIYLLLRNNADMYLFNRCGVSAFSLAITMGNIKAVDLFLKQGINLNHSTDILQNSGLHTAAIFNQREILRLLVSKGGNLRLLNENNETAIELLLAQSCKIEKQKYQICSV